MRRIHRSKVLHAQVTAFLADLGSTGAEVAIKLASERVQGVPGDAHDCAVANYLHAVLGADCRVRSIRVTNGRVGVLRSRRRPIWVLLPDPVRAFIARFDEGAFPLLVRTARNPTEEARAAGPVHDPPSPGNLSGLPPSSALIDGRCQSVSPQTVSPMSPEPGGLAGPAQDGS